MIGQGKSLLYVHACWSRVLREWVMGWWVSVERIVDWSKVGVRRSYCKKFEYVWLEMVSTNR